MYLNARVCSVGVRGGGERLREANEKTENPPEHAKCLRHRSEHQETIKESSFPEEIAIRCDFAVERLSSSLPSSLASLPSPSNTRAITIMQPRIVALACLVLSLYVAAVIAGT